MLKKQYNIEEWEYYGTTFTDSAYELDGVHVGASRLWIIWRYRHQTPVKEEAMGDSYFELRYLNLLSFTYDENDRVSSISFWR